MSSLAAIHFIYSSHKNLNQFGTSKQHVWQLSVSIITTILKAFEIWLLTKTLAVHVQNNKLDQAGQARLVSHIFPFKHALLPIQIPIHSDTMEKRNAINLYLPITLITSSCIILILIKSFKTSSLFQKQSLTSYVQEELRKSSLKCGTLHKHSAEHMQRTAHLLLHPTNPLTGWKGCVALPLLETCFLCLLLPSAHPAEAGESCASRTLVFVGLRFAKCYLTSEHVNKSRVERN